MDGTKAIFRHDFMRRRFSLLAFCVMAMAFVCLYLSLFPTVRAQAEQFSKIFESMPKGFLQAMGVESLNFSSLERFLSIELYTVTFPLITILLATSRAGNALAGEAETGTLGFLLAQPISRQKMYAAKAGAGAAQIGTFALASAGSIIPLSWLFGLKAAAGNVLLMVVLGALFGLAIFSIVFMLSAIFDDKGKVYAIAGGLLMTMYVINILANLKESLQWLRNFSLFHYFNASDALVNGTLKTVPAAVFLSVTLFTLVAGYLFFRRHDLSI